MVSLMCHLEWAKGCPECQYTIISRCVHKCFWKRLTFAEVDWVKKICCHRCRWGVIHSVENLHQKGRGRATLFSHLKLGLLFPPALGHQSYWFSAFWAPAFTLAVSRSAPQVFRPSSSGWIIPVVFLVL